MKKYILVQSLRLFEFAKKKFSYEDQENLVWVTTSPFLHNYFEINNYNFINLESLVELNEYNELMSIVLENYPKLDVPPIINLMNKDEYNNYLINIFTPLVDTILYKTFLINNFYEKCKGKIIIISSEDKDPNFLEKISITSNSINGRRFTDYFSRIARKNFSEIELIYCPEDTKILTQKIDEIQGRSMNFFEKLLSLLNNNLSSILFKCFLKLYEKKIIKKVRLNIFKRNKQIVIGSPTDHIEEAFLSLILNGYEITFLKKSNDIQLLKPNEDAVLKEFENLNHYKSTLKKKIQNTKKINLNKSYLDTLDESLLVLSYAIAELKKNYSSIENHVKKLSNIYDKNHIFMSNYFYDIIDVAYISFLKKNNNKVVYVEHGPANGITEASKIRSPHYPMMIANEGIYVWETSLKYIKDSLKNQKIYIAGFTNKMTTRIFFYVKKYLIKKILKIKNNKKNICIVADRERNNSMHGPYSENDLLYYQVTRDTVDYFCRKFPDKNICLKLYPTNIYAQNYDFEDLKEKYLNLKVIRFIDFRFIREIFDEIYVFNGQSGLCWALASNADTFLINKKYQYCNVEELTASKHKININNVSNVTLLKKKFIKNDNSWIKIF
jgi:hypothetical protein